MQAPLEFDELPIPTNGLSSLTAKETVCWLMYRTYAGERRRGIHPERMRIAFGIHVEKLEGFYQRELKREAQTK